MGAEENSNEENNTPPEDRVVSDSSDNKGAKVNPDTGKKQSGMLEVELPGPNGEPKRYGG